MQLLAIDYPLSAKFFPVVANDLELQGYGCQLGRGGVAYFYCEFFHVYYSAFSVSITTIFSSRSLLSALRVSG